jgi:hypothetical protein
LEVVQTVFVLLFKKVEFCRIVMERTFQRGPELEFPPVLHRLELSDQLWIGGSDRLVARVPVPEALKRLVPVLDFLTHVGTCRPAHCRIVKSRQEKGKPTHPHPLLARFGYSRAGSNELSCEVPGGEKASCRCENQKEED